MPSITDAIQPGGPLAALALRNQFILCKGKMPVNPSTLQVHDAHDPTIWITAQAAAAMARDIPGYGVGFVFTADDPFYFLDIDKCLLDDGATWSPIANELLTTLEGAAVEVSQSGRGLHIFGRTADLPHGNKNIDLGIELYTQGRFVALTGANAIGDANTDNTAALTSVITQYFPAAGSPGAPAEWSDHPVPDWVGPDSDEALILKACASTSAGARLGGRAAFADLWTNNTVVLASTYPDTEGDRPYDSSSADAALAQHLAFWTGKDCERMARIMRMSSLKRDKWEREDYIHRTIIRAISLQEGVYNAGYRSTPAPTPAPDNPTAPTTPPVAPMSGDEVRMRDGTQFMTATQQVEWFKDCVYIVDMDRVFCPDGSLLNSDRFRRVYGGYIFTLDSLNDKTTKNAWEAFTESQAIHYPKANSTCFRPQIAPGALIVEEGRTLVNIYVPVPVQLTQGDPAPFLEHLVKMLPDAHDRAILLAYIAAIVQYKGIKFKWAPLIQGIEGNGKTLITQCTARAIGRKFVHFPNSADLDNKFNAWLPDKILIAVEDIKVTEHRQQILERLKPLITAGEGIEIQKKGVDQTTQDICANFIFNSNHPDALRKARTDRHYGIFFTAQQRAGDLERHGMGGDYFPKLYAWLNGGGYAIVANYLHAYQIPDELNPAKLLHRAPHTSTTNDAIALSLGGVEQEILEAVEAGRHGFCGGWISSIALNSLLEAKRMDRMIPLNKRRQLLQSIGYDWHRSLTLGRLNNPLKDGSKPKIFIREDHPHNILPAAEVGTAYEKAQAAPQLGLPGIVSDAGGVASA